MAKKPRQLYDYTVKNNGTLVGVFKTDMAAQDAICRGLDAGRSVTGYTVVIHGRGEESPVNPTEISAEDFLNR